MASVSLSPTVLRSDEAHHSGSVCYFPVLLPFLLASEETKKITCSFSLQLFDLRIVRGLRAWMHRLLLARGNHVVSIISFILYNTHATVAWQLAIHTYAPGSECYRLCLRSLAKGGHGKKLIFASVL